MGENELQDFLANVENRFNSLENLLRNHAQLISKQQEDIEEVRNLLIQTSEKAASLDVYAQNVDKRVTESQVAVQERYDGAVIKVNDRCQMHDNLIFGVGQGQPGEGTPGMLDRLIRVEQMVELAMREPMKPPNPPGIPTASPEIPHYMLSPTKQPVSPSVDTRIEEPSDPWAKFVKQGGINGMKLPSPAPAVEKEIQMPQTRPPQIGAQQMPIYQTRVPRVEQLDEDVAEGIHSMFMLPGGRQQPFVGQGSQDVLQAFKISRKHVHPQLKIFSGRIGTFTIWREYLSEHCAESNRRWKRILENVRVAETPLTREKLMATPIGQGYTAWDLAEDFEAFIKKYIHEDLRNRFYDWTAGEDGNGFEMFRRMFQEYEGGGMLIEMGGRRILNNFGRCGAKDDVLKHWSEWTELLTKHGKDLLANPKELYYRAIEIVPAEWEDEITQDKTIQTHHDIYAYIQRKCIYRRHKEQQKNYVNQHARGRTPLKVMGEYNQGCQDAKCGDANCGGQMKVQDIVEATINAIQQSRNDKPVRPRSPSPSGGPRFWFEKDCFECGGMGHQRKDCEVYKKLLKENGGKRPKGHQGAFEKARSEFRKKHAKARSPSPKTGRPQQSRDRDRKKSMKPLLSETESLSSDSESEDSNVVRGAGLRLSGVRPTMSVFHLPIKTQNKYQSLDDGEPHKEDPEDVEDVARTLSAWATVKHRSSQRRTKNNSNKKGVVIRDEKDALNLFGLPVDGRSPEALLAASKMMPSDEELEEGECWMMVDSGAGCNAAKGKKHFRGYRRRKTESPQKVILADGTEVVSKGVIDANLLIQDEVHQAPFEDLPVECPIISVRRICRKKNRVTFELGGGHIYNAETGKKLYFVERNSVYFIKVKILPPSDLEDESGFARRGR